MAIVGRVGNFKLLKSKSSPITVQVCSLRTDAAAAWNMKKSLYAAMGVAAGGIGALMLALDQSVKAYDWPCHPPHYPWSHKPLLGAFDHASIRRGFEVYRNVCSACHSLQFIPFRRLVNVAYTAEEMKEIAAEYQIQDGPDDNGEMFMRPGKPSDYFPKPYVNTEAAKAANNGAAPPDLSLIALGREGEGDYIFSLLNGYHEAPAGVEVPENGNYNPYFQGSVIAMAPPLYDGIIEYEDGTPATKSQLAKDVVTFLAWCAQPEMEKRKLMGLKLNLFLIPFAAILFYITRLKWAPLRARQVILKELAKQTKKK